MTSEMLLNTDHQHRVAGLAKRRGCQEHMTDSRPEEGRHLAQELKFGQARVVRLGAPLIGSADWGSGDSAV
ncbi:Gtpase-Activating Rap/Ran-Gap Domain-Like Protein 3 [Manis pentadactyla]|nr:Gtpase-Activating Rap/Ran-Gap Domain-Like Protein 3 [Manis pentadactyla]